MTAKTAGSQQDYGHPHIIERPDGFYWQNPEDDREYGPFSSLNEAELDMDLADGEALDAMEDAEGEIGIADWIDPETGQPAEDSIPHLDDL
jgi:hypothetical protein